MRFEEVLDSIGPFGRYQQRIFFVICLRTVCSSMVAFSHVFLAGQTDHWCRAPELDIVNCSKWSLDTEECVEAKKSVSVPPAADDGNSYKHCVRYNLTGFEPSDWYPGWVTSDLTNNTLDCDAGWVYDKSQFMTTIISDFDLVCEKDNLADLSESMFFVGVFIGSALLGYLSDRIGRRKTFVLAVAIGSVCILLSALSYDYIMFTILRLCIGCFFFSTNAVGYTLISEFVSPRWRAIAINSPMFFWAFGYMCLAGLGYFIRSWRILLFVITGFCFVTLLLMPFIAESPRWLISRGRTSEAEKVIRKVAEVNKKKMPEEFFKSLELQEQNSNTDISGARTSEQASIIDLFRYGYMRFKIMILLWIWFFTSLTYFGLSLSTADLGINFYLWFFISGAVEIPALLYVQFGLDKFGRKVNLCGSLIASGVACLISDFIKNTVWRTTVAMIGKFFITMTFSIVFIVTVEQLPTPVRNVGLGMSSAIGRIGGITAPLINIIGKYWSPLPFLLYGTCSVIGGMLALLLPETKGENLLDTIEEGRQFGKRKDDRPTSNNLKEDNMVIVKDIGTQTFEDNFACVAD